MEEEIVKVCETLLKEIRSLKEINHGDNRYDQGYQHGRSSCEAIVERMISRLKEGCGR